MNKQLLTFLSLFSIVLVLSIYYVMIPFSVEKKSPQATEVGSTLIEAENAYFDTLNLEREQYHSEEIAIEISKISSVDITNLEKENALNRIAIIEKVIENEKNLEASITMLGYKNCFVEIKNNTINVLVSKDNPTKYDAAEIIYTVQDLLDIESPIYVEFHS